jgi:DHA3 family multidrug efflux protein-like MFS transporter
MKTFYKLLVNTLLANVVNNFLWFALIFWAYLETRSVMATSIIGGSYMLCSAVFGLVFGTYVDRHKKKTAMWLSSVISLMTFAGAGLLYVMVGPADLLSLGSPQFWALVLLILSGAVAGNLRNIAISTCVTLLVPAKRHDKANGMVGTAMGLSFTITSIFSGLSIGYLGMGWTLAVAIGLTALIWLHLLAVPVKEELAPVSAGRAPAIDLKGALEAVFKVKGLMALLLFATFNNFLGGVFMSLMDAYGLNLMSVQAWGMLWGVLSAGFIIGGAIVAMKGLGKQPLRMLFLMNILMWMICILFPVKSSILPLAIGMLLYLTLIPVVEAAEQTIIQKVVPFESQGRVFGFGQMIENAASPLTAFLIGPIAQLWVIPFMTDGYGAHRIGGWFGTGAARGMALIFMVAGVIGLAITIIAMSSRSYKWLTKSYAAAAD